MTKPRIAPPAFFSWTKWKKEFAEREKLKGAVPSSAHYGFKARQKRDFTPTKKEADAQP